MAQIYQLFKKAMDRHGVQGKELAAIVGITPNHLSDFRNGKKWVSQEILASLLEGMEQLSPGSKRYFCELLAGETLVEVEEQKDNSKRLVELIEAADDEDMDAVLLAIGRKWKRSRQNPAIPNNYTNSLDSAIAV